MYVHDVWNDNVPNNNIPQNSNIVNVSYDVDMAIGRYLSGEATMEDANLFLPGNTANRQAFYEATGIRLPDTVGGIQSILISTNLPEYIKAMDEITASQKNAKLIEIYRNLEKVSRKPDSLTGKNESGIIKKDIFYSIADPMAEVTGDGETSHPKEIKKFREKLEKLGVKLIEKDYESLGYAPGLMPGVPGIAQISKGSSYSAWCHEMKHVMDDYAAGWQGMRILENLDEHYAREVAAYQIEIDMAIQLGRKDIADRLRINLERERVKIYGK